MTSAQQTDHALLTELARFEKCLETPVVPGELPNWLEAARDSCEKLGPLLRREVDETHELVLRHITRQDLELAPRVEQLKAKDTELLGRWKSIEDELHELCGKAAQAEPHEARLDDQVSRFTQAALTFVIEARKQETALTTWYMESLNRDRGVAD